MSQLNTKSRTFDVMQTISRGWRQSCISIAAGIWGWVTALFWLYCSVFFSPIGINTKGMWTRGTSGSGNGPHTLLSRQTRASTRTPTICHNRGLLQTPGPQPYGMQHNHTALLIMHGKTCFNSAIQNHTGRGSTVDKEHHRSPWWQSSVENVYQSLAETFFA